jgi:hypothetical protein
MTPTPPISQVISNPKTSVGCIWCFDPEWGPTFISSWDTFALTGEGKYFSDVMHAKAAEATPAAAK